nr:MAG TPA: hypothetical protein [Caudoviricetes sp.]
MLLWYYQQKRPHDSIHRLPYYSYLAGYTSMDTVYRIPLLIVFACLLQ